MSDYPSRCGLCGIEPALGFSIADGVRLCHDDTLSCYRQWTVYGNRPTVQYEKLGIKSGNETTKEALGLGLIGPNTTSEK